MEFDEVDQNREKKKKDSESSGILQHSPSLKKALFGLYLCDFLVVPLFDPN